LRRESLKRHAESVRLGLGESLNFVLLDLGIDVFNNERPHEALDMKCPAEIYQPSPRIYQGLPDIDYPFHDRTIVVTHCGRICLGKKELVGERPDPVRRTYNDSKGFEWNG